MDINNEELKKYEKDYSEEGLFAKVSKYAAVIGKELIFKVFQLWYILQKPDLPASVRMTIIAALGYLISPLDIVPDLIPLVGYTDDASVIAMALLFAAMYVDDEVNEKARKQVEHIFGEDAEKIFER